MVSYCVLLYLFPPWKDTEMAAYDKERLLKTKGRPLVRRDAGGDC